MKAITIIAITLLASVSAQARVHHHRRHVTMTRPGTQNAPWSSFSMLGGLFDAPQTSLQPALGAHRRVIAGHDVGTIVSHPAGCPARLFCACGVSVRVFGHSVRSLWLASEWVRRFPHVSPADGMVAARSGHAFYIERYLGNGRAIAYDANSGHGLTRIHEISIRGYTIVNPHGVNL